MNSIENYFFDEDMEDIIKNFNNRLEEAKYINDLIYIFEEEVEKKMKDIQAPRTNDVCRV
jgi:hypothetical protein